MPMADDDIARHFGPTLRALRHERGMSQERLAGDAGIHPTAITRFETGTREPRLRTIVKLARALDVDPGRLFDWPRD